MIEIHNKASSVIGKPRILTLPFSLRQKSRFKCQLDDGTPCTVILPRGEGILRSGDKLEASSGPWIEVQAQSELLAIATTSSALVFARMCYHLGNRHVPLQITEQEVRFQPDHVLEKMLKGLGCQVRHEEKPFEPEDGAYDRGKGASHGH